jgi:type I restriction-modification system DNA methylase subunit
VQITLNRIVFVKNCEDREIETKDSLKKCIETAKTEGDFYKNLYAFFKSLDKKYNAGLFDFTNDNISENISISNATIRVIIEGIYYPISSYVFSVIGIEILGTVYERFLGKVISIGKNRKVTVEEKPEVRKAGGVFYTPQYIVEYIVQNTVGKLIEGKTPDEIAAFTICDPACGSGSFLIGAYEYLLNYHLDWYYKEKMEGKKKYKQIDNPLTPDNKLSINVKKRILINNIFGVDLDSQAIEVTKLSLLMKCLEGDTLASIALTHEKLLPNLDNNIRVGNSLIDIDFYEGNDDVVNKKVKPFNWQFSFSQVFKKKKGFDVIIGNPPYVFTREVDFSDKIKEYYKKSYLSILTKDYSSKDSQVGKINLYAIFILQGLNLLNKDGLFGYIIPNTLLRTTIYESIRKYLLDNISIKKIVDLKSGVFQNVTVSTILFFLQKNNNSDLIEIINNPTKLKTIDDNSLLVNKNNFKQNTSYSFNIFVQNSDTDLFVKMNNKSIYLSELVNIYNGISTFKNMQGVSNKPHNKSYKKLIMGKDIGRFNLKWNNKYIEYVRANLQRAREESIFTHSEKLVMQRIGGILITAYDNQQYYTYNSVNNLISKDESVYSLKYILGLLNSKLLQFFYIKNFTNNSSLTVNISKTFLDKLPIAKIDFSIKMEKQKYDEIITIVDLLLTLNANLHKSINLQTKKDKDKIEMLKSRIFYAEQNLNQIVYQLYGLTDEEIDIVDNS